MDECVKSFQNLIAQSFQNFETAQGVNPHKAKFNRWKYCVALAARGWKAYSAERIGDPEQDDILVKWRKEGEKDIEIRLSFTEQCLWLEYMEQKEKNKDEHSE